MEELIKKIADAKGLQVELRRLLIDVVKKIYDDLEQEVGG